MSPATQPRAIRAFAVIATITALMVGALPALAAEDDVEFNGAGWGHGVGMSQWGAYAQAQVGRTYGQIISHYYAGTSLASYDTIKPGHGNLWVNLETDRTNLILRVENTLNQLAGGGHAPATVTRGAQSQQLTHRQQVQLIWLTENTCTTEFYDLDDGFADPFAVWAVGSCDIDVTWDGETADPTTSIRIEGCFLREWDTGLDRRCRYGRGVALHTKDNESPWRTSSGRDPAFDGYDLVLEIDVDDYTRGISEVSYAWPTASLKAQAVTARSYAAEASERLNPSAQKCACELRDTSASQRYVGWGHTANQARWIGAVEATDNQIVTHPSVSILSTVYSSSNGGRSEAVHERWGGAPRSYLSSVDDPWSLDPPNPRRSWQFTMNAGTLAAKVWGADPPVLSSVRVIARNTSGSAKTVEFQSADGDVTTRSASWMTAAAGLYSWYFDVNYGSGGQPPPDPGPDPDPTMSAQVGLQDPRTGIWHIRHTDGSVDSYYYGNPRDTPYAGDWNGNGVDTMGLYRESTGFLFLRNTNNQGVANVDIYYGIPGDQPVGGDWNGDGVDTVGIFRPSQGKFYLRNTNTQGIADIEFAFGQPGDVPIAGDWDADGVDTVGVYRPSNKTVYLLNDFSDTVPDIVFDYSGTASGDRIVVGDWDGDGDDTVGVFRPSSKTWYLRDTFTQSSANIVFTFGESHMNPVAGDWGG
jgi:SpoIID/LytB domain protein